MAPAPAANEADRLTALASYEALDTPSEFAYDTLTELAAEICGCPVALISLVDEHRQWFKSRYGLPADFTECPRDVSVCSSAICSNDLLYVPDLTADERFRHLPIVLGEPNLRFYCGMPLINKDGYSLGTLCVVDFQARELTPSQREAVRRLAQQTMAHLELRRQVLERDALVGQLMEARAAADAERERSDGLLQRILPASVAAELRTLGCTQPRYYESATVMFTDFREFSRLAEALDPARLIENLNRYFARFDEIAAANRVETLKTIGDAYMCVGGVPAANRTHAIDACLAALQIRKFVKDTNAQRAKLRLPPWELRIGLNTGPLIAGVVGARRFSYDVWGNAVNIAQRLEAACKPGDVNISASTWHHVAPLFKTTPRGPTQAKHMGLLDMYVVERIRPELSADADGTQPNDRFWGTEWNTPAVAAQRSA